VAPALIYIRETLALPELELSSSVSAKMLARQRAAGGGSIPSKKSVLVNSIASLLVDVMSARDHA
jgi:hypothetical protein